MSEIRLVRRYNAFYQGWCLAFGEHHVSFQEERNINWLFGEERIGLAIASQLRKRIYRELLGQLEKPPVVVLGDSCVRINNLLYRLNDEAEEQHMRELKRFALTEKNLHMYLCSHFAYPPRTRIITFSRKRPLPIIYKEMLPLNLIIE
ncbi:MAG: hypothetical protein GY703_23980 [Gammaproteobacteria bacterium]|nr:hypothetical protein [Gammaproteobacteria bacterium]